MVDQQKDAPASLEKKSGSSASASASASTSKDQEEVVTIPKSQIQLLYAQINDLAKSVAEKEKQAARSSSGRAPTASTSNQAPPPQRQTPSTPTKSYTPRTPRKQASSQHASQFGAGVISVAGSTLTPDDIKSLLDSLPVYTGALGECFKWWAQQLESFCKTFNLKMNQIEHYIPQLLIRGRALERYREVQREVNSTSSSMGNNGKTEKTAEGSTNTPSTTTGTWYRRSLPWHVLSKELSKLDNPVLRSIYIHEQIQSLRKTTLNPSSSSILPSSSSTSFSTGPNLIDEQAVTALVTKFRKLESQLDPAPLGDRLYLIVDCVLPEARHMILGKISVDTLSVNTPKPQHGGHAAISKLAKQHLIFHNVDEVCDFILIHLDELIKSIHASSTSSSTNATAAAAASTGFTISIPTATASTANANTTSSASSSGSASPPLDSQGQGQANANAPLCNYCNKSGHLANKCFKRKKNRQREKVKLYDSMQLQNQQTQTQIIAGAASGSTATLTPSAATTVDDAAES